MARTAKPQIVLLRGINLGPRNRISMPPLREALTAAGLENVRTYVQSGNIVVDSALSPARLADAVRAVLVDGFDLDVPIVTRTRDELAAVVEHDPFGDIADPPKLYSVTFLSGKPPADTLKRLEGIAQGDERVAVHGREIYTWHPDGIARSKLALGVVDPKKLGLVASARNWTTVRKLLELADEA